MDRTIVLLSGPIASGKTTLGDALIERHRFLRVKTRELLAAIIGNHAGRLDLQEAGDQLDRRTKGSWIASALARQLAGNSIGARILIDSVRIPEQIDAIRRSFGNRVVHVHLTAPPKILKSRFLGRAGAIGEARTYAQAKQNITESSVERLADIADIVIDTSSSLPADVVARVASHLGLYGRAEERLVDVLVGGQFGSEGKGHIASYLAPEYDVLVRVGGPNAGHKVYEEPTPYTHHHLPSGTRFSEAKIVLGPGATLWIPGLRQEIADCQISSERLSIDPQAIIIEEEDRQFESKKLKSKIASTAQGVGAATSRKILRSGATPRVRLAKQMKELRPYLRPTVEVLEDAFANSKKVFLEGTQGTGLSIHHGAYPYVTSRETSVSGCIAEAGIAPSRVRRIILVCRTYPIRVQNPAGGTSGPMSKEISWEEVAKRSGIPLAQLVRTEKTSTTHRQRRVGEFDWAQLRLSASLNGPTDVALTFADYVSKMNQNARRFEQLTPDTLKFIAEIEQVANCPVSLIGTRFHSRSIIDRRSW